MPDSNPGKILVGLRLAIGGAGWLAPRKAGTLFGLDAASQPQLAYVGRLFAARDAILGIGVIASEGEARKTWWRLGIACDAMDALAGLAAGSRGELSPGSTAMVTGTALLAVALGAAALGADS